MREGEMELRHLLTENLEEVSDAIEQGRIFHLSDDRPVTEILIDAEGVGLRWATDDVFNIDPYTMVEVRPEKVVRVLSFRAGGVGITLRIPSVSDADAFKRLMELGGGMDPMFHDTLLHKEGDIDVRIYIDGDDLADEMEIEDTEEWRG